MKYLQDDRLSEITGRLQKDDRDRHIYGRIEAYTTKRAGNDKKYAADLGTKYVEWQESVEQSQQSTAASSSFTKPTRKRSQSEGGLPTPKQPRRQRAISLDEKEQSTGGAPSGATESLANRRRLLTDLILTLNMSFPDYDFGEIRPNDFEKVSLQDFYDHVNRQLEVIEQQESVLPDLWSAMDNVIDLKDSEVYVWKNTEDLLSNEALLWSFYYLVVNKSLKRIVFFACAESMGSAGEEENNESDEVLAEVVEESEEEDEEDDRLMMTESSEVDFDLDPSATPAGGIPLSTV